MCCCGTPNINGQPGYSWDGRHFGTYPVAPPPVENGDELLHDLPGRCGGVDSHAYHFRVVKQRYGGFALLVRHGGGNERVNLGHRSFLIGVLGDLDDHTRYWLLQSIYHAQKDAVRAAKEETDSKWRQAAADKRIKTRK